MEPPGSIANELYSNILQSETTPTATQEHDNFHENEAGELWYDEESPFEDSEKLSHQFHTIGYRDGIIAGKEAALQEGFNVGFKNSVIAGYNWGLVRGICSAMASLPNGLKEKLVEAEETRSKFQLLHESVQSISSADASKLFYEDRRRESPKQQETNQSKQSPDVGVLENYHVQLQSILQECPLVEEHFK